MAARHLARASRGVRNGWICPEEYPGCRVKVWVNYPRRLNDELNSGDDDRIIATLLKIVVAHNDWVDGEYAPAACHRSRLLGHGADRAGERHPGADRRPGGKIGCLDPDQERTLSAWLYAAYARGESTAGFAAHPRIGPLPWAYVRRLIAERWHCTPWQVDEAPAYEVNLEVQLMGIESQARPRPGED